MANMVIAPGIEPQFFLPNAGALTLSYTMIIDDEIGKDNDFTLK